MTFLSPMIMIALFSLVAYLTQMNNNKARTISIFDETGLISSAFENSDNTTYLDLSALDFDTAIEQVKSAATYGLLVIEKSENNSEVISGVKFYSEESPSLNVISSLESKVKKQVEDIKLEHSGVDMAKISAAKTKINIAQVSFAGAKTSKIDNVLKLGFGGAAGYLLFMFIIIYGNMIMRSVIEEKTSRIIEIIISSVKPITLMMGKIIGTSLAGITQFAIWIVLGGLMVFGLSSFFGVDISQSPQQEAMQQAMASSDMQNQMQDVMTAFYNLPIVNLVIAFLFFFIGGYLLYSSLYAAIGAAVDNETDTQQFMMPVLMPLILAVYVGFFTVIEDPHGTVSTVFSFIPFTSPVVMLMRIPFGVPIWQQVVSLLILIATFVFTVWFAAKIYRIGILMYGKKPTYKELFKWMKY